MGNASVANGNPSKGRLGQGGDVPRRPAMSTGTAGRSDHAALHGRGRECAMLDRLIARARRAESQVLVLRGDAGIGKTALLDYLSAAATDYSVVRAAGVEAEMELAFAGLQQLCAPMLDHVDRLPGPQRDALATAVGLHAGAAPDRFLVGLGVLSLLAEVTEKEPLLCVIDDAQWLDRASAQTLAFVARRLQAEPIVMLIATRPTLGEDVFARLPELVVRGLSDAHARSLLDAVLLSPLDPAVRDRLAAEAQGNPLALLELPRSLTPADLAGGFGLLTATPVVIRLEETFRRRLVELPPDTRMLLLVAAADPLGDPGLLWRAAERLGITSDAADAATAAGLVEIGRYVRFRHPVVRSTVYRAAPGADRRRAHRALADVTDPKDDPDRRAWHHACSVIATDESVAQELEHSAQRALARGGAAAAAAFLARAMAVTPEPGSKGARAIAAARASIDAGAPEAGSELLAVAERCPLAEVDRANLERLRAELAFTLTRGNEAPALLLSAAKRLEPLDVKLARETHLEAVSAAQFAGRLAVGVDVLGAAEAARAAPRPVGPPRPPDLLLDGLAVRFTDGYAAGAPLLQRALRAFRGPDVSVEENLRWLFRASTAALDLWDDDTWEVLASRHLQLARDTGALAVLPLALTLRIAMHVFAGEPVAATSLIDQAKAVVAATGMKIAPYGELLFAAWRGREPEATALMAATEEAVLARGEGVGLSVIEWATALVANAAGRYEQSLAPALRASEHTGELGVSAWALTEAVEAASRLGDGECATRALRRLSTITRAAGTDWALGVEARSRALVSDAQKAEPFYRESIERLRRTRIRPELARSHLVYGEWLRRANRRVDAREHLRAAHDLCVSVGAEGFADRARRELLATGETVRRRRVDSITEFTPQEAQIARLAADLHTNAEIGAQLFLSPRTVEWHLRKVFTKLGISSRRELRSALPR
ncbi:MAG: AAA family ATPase [Actinomycetota bacterium]|nr:AAA family ATPase [Actinomycetota bacterium]